VATASQVGRASVRRDVNNRRARDCACGHAITAVNALASSRTHSRRGWTGHVQRLTIVTTERDLAERYRVAGEMFWLSLKKLSGSYFRFSSRNRLYLSAPRRAQDADGVANLTTS
jgi:hypothetical protein